MDTIEFNTRFLQMERSLTSFALKLTNNMEDAKDLVQETGYRAYDHKESFQVDSNFRAWLTVIMRNTFINDYRKRKRRNIWFESMEEKHHGQVVTKNSAESNLLMQELTQVLDKMDAAFRTPFLMHYQGYKYEEISQELNLPLGTVKSRIFFARKKLRSKIER